MSASIGIARADHGESTDELGAQRGRRDVRREDRGKGTRVLFEPAMHTAALERLVVEADLRTAIEREEFMLQYQPSCCSTGEM